MISLSVDASLGGNPDRRAGHALVACRDDPFNLYLFGGRAKSGSLMHGLNDVWRFHEPSMVHLYTKTFLSRRRINFKLRPDMDTNGDFARLRSKRSPAQWCCYHAGNAIRIRWYGHLIGHALWRPMELRLAEVDSYIHSCSIFSFI